MKRKWQVWSYSWSYVTERGPCPIPETLLFGGQAFPTRKAAESAWYDTIPGRNDRAVFLKTATACKGVTL